MRDPKRIKELLGLIESIWDKQPDLRFNQLLYILQSEYSQMNNNFGRVEAKDKDGYLKIGFDLFNVDDDKFIEFLRQRLEDYN